MKRNELLEGPPVGFEDLRKGLAYSETEISDDEGCQTGLWIVVTDGQNYVPSELGQRQKVYVDVEAENYMIC